MKKIVLAYSGGLDTSVILTWLKEEYDVEVVAYTADVGQGEEVEEAKVKAMATGAVEAIAEDLTEEFVSEYVFPALRANAIYEGHYLLGTSLARPVIAKGLVRAAEATGADGIAHGATGKGNDQVRFEVALRTLNPGLEILAPVRDNSWVRDEQLAYLEKHDMPLPAQGSAYSINRGLWGITIGGQETLTSKGSIPESAWVLSPDAFSEPKEQSQHTLEFSKGVPAKLDGKALPPVKLIEALEQLAGSYGIGRGIHLGDTVLGTKGRVAFEAPAAITLITAHRELEKLVLSAQQARIKDNVAAVYGDLVHEGKQLDLACNDIEALLLSSQERVSGQVHFTLRPGQLFIDGVESDYSLLAATKGVYGEYAGEWTPADALGYARVLSLTGSLQTRAGENGS